MTRLLLAVGLVIVSGCGPGARRPIGPKAPQSGDELAKAYGDLLRQAGLADHLSVDSVSSIKPCDELSVVLRMPADSVGLGDFHRLADVFVVRTGFPLTRWLTQTWAVLSRSSSVRIEANGCYFHLCRTGHRLTSMVGPHMMCQGGFKPARYTQSIGPFAAGGSKATTAATTQALEHLDRCLSRRLNVLDVSSSVRQLVKRDGLRELSVTLWTATGVVLRGRDVQETVELDIAHTGGQLQWYASGVYHEFERQHPLQEKPLRRWLREVGEQCGQD